MTKDCLICRTRTNHSILFYLLELNIVKCRNCGHKTLDKYPEPVEIKEVNTGMYQRLSKEYDFQKYKWAKESVDVYLKKIQPQVSRNSSLLDIGGGLGYYSKAFQEKGIKTTLIDLDIVSLEFAKTKQNIDEVFQGTTLDFLIKYPQRKFDIIFCRHVIEHIENPLLLIQDINMLLKSDGILILETDNSKSHEILLNYGTKKFYHNLYKEKFVNYSLTKLVFNPIFALDPPRHLHAFDIKNLKIFLINNGFKIKEAQSYSFGSKLWPNIPNTSFKQLLNSLKTFSKKSIKINTYNFFGGFIRYILNKYNRGAGIIIIAKKL
ncbi:MAG: class I SAM-dependent methyltransferase [Bacteroidales bacterium]|nr:class I SAM-dependent methyltransferase [Bacteroidales bacterium]